MKTDKRLNVLLSFITLFCSTAAAKDYYVSPSGSDSGAGTLDAPFATLRKAQAVVRPGDTVYLRAGVYKIASGDIMSVKGNYACVFFLSKSGTADAPIRYMAYPGDEGRPVFDVSEVKPEGQRVSVFYLHGSYLHLKGFDITGIQVTTKTHTQSEGISGRNGSHNIVENVAVHHGMGIGFYFTRGSYNKLINCDAYCNYDSISDNGKGGNTDGFGFHFVKPEYVGNSAKGCRAWMNSDDGFDFIGCRTAVELDSCWAFYNGWKDEKTRTPGDGNGFKCGGYGKKVQKEEFDVPSHYIHNCIAARNKASGFYANHHLGGSKWVNNSAMSNRTNYNMVNQQSWDKAVDVPGYGHVMVRNISYKGTRRENGDTINIDAKRCVLSDNCFSVTDKKPFKSTNLRLLMSPRKADGSLPDTDFMKIADENSLCNKLRVGYEYKVEK